MRFYITDEQGFREVSESEHAEYKAFLSEEAKFYKQVKSGEISVSDVPETYRNAVVDRLAPTTEEKAKAYDILVGVSE